MSTTSPSNSYRKVIDLRINCNGLPRKTAKVSRKKSALSVFAVFIGIMKDCGYSDAEINHALNFFSDPMP